MHRHRLFQFNTGKRCRQLDMCFNAFRVAMIDSQRFWRNTHARPLGLVFEADFKSQPDSKNIETQKAYNRKRAAR